MPPHGDTIGWYGGFGAVFFFAHLKFHVSVRRGKKSVCFSVRWLRSYFDGAQHERGRCSVARIIFCSLTVDEPFFFVWAVGFPPAAGLSLGRSPLVIPYHWPITFLRNFSYFARRLLRQRMVSRRGITLLRLWCHGGAVCSRSFRGIALRCIGCGAQTTLKPTCRTELTP